MTLEGRILFTQGQEGLALMVQQKWTHVTLDILIYVQLRGNIAKICLILILKMMIFYDHVSLKPGNNME